MEQLANVIVIFISFSLGIIIGFLINEIIHRLPDKTMDKLMSRHTLQNIIALVVVVVWALATIVSLINPSIQVPLAVHALMGSIVGFFFHDELLGKKHD